MDAQRHGRPAHAPTVDWQVDDRHPTAYTRLYVLGMRLRRDKEAFEGERNTLDTARQLQRKGNAPPTRPTRWTTRVTEEQVSGMAVWRVRPRRGEPRGAVFYVHGGGYVHPLTPDYWRLVRLLARSGVEVIVPAYPLAPDATVDEVLPRLLEVVQHAAERTPGGIVLMGDSAGGALVLVLAQRLRDLGGGPPAGVVALCPWLDATLDEEEVAELEASDPMLAESGLRAAGRWWAGERDPADPLVSPVNGSLSGLPPVDVLIGDRDILRPAVDRLAERAGPDADLHVHEVPAMFHVWMTRAIPEARRTRRFLRDLVARRLAGSGQ